MPNGLDNKEGVGNLRGKYLPILLVSLSKLGKRCKVWIHLNMSRVGELATRGQEAQLCDNIKIC